MKNFIALVFVFTLLLVSCKPKASKEQKTTQEVPTETVVPPYENVSESVERIDSVAAELESSIEKLDEALNELE
ncbi:hypothetical protein KDU71_09185 [Carboxylicivirga sediminis]|uniref:Lipoprotein n=1 Tax=Carboxylicivirga sediminis TaxID=2006564 RepID=A0A941F3M1_9BACT|nr:hypothetical protein [Carboxylicivirga sediminis]MBR8535727.1 hypothetical protein [Carboxylicivirga sediminis]